MEEKPKKQIFRRPQQGEYDLDVERRNLRDFLLSNGLEIDTGFYDAIECNDIIEVYAVPANVQIYCNQEFLKICSYTQEQMSTIPFPELFWRSDEDHFALMRRASYVAAHEHSCLRWDLPSHELVESLHPRKRTFEMKMGWIAPCFDSVTKARRAWASTLQVSLIFEWSEDLE